MEDVDWGKQEKKEKFAEEERKELASTNRGRGAKGRAKGHGKGSGCDRGQGISPTDGHALLFKNPVVNNGGEWEEHKNNWNADAAEKLELSEASKLLELTSLYQSEG